MARPLAGSYICIRVPCITIFSTAHLQFVSSEINIYFFLFWKETSFPTVTEQLFPFTILHAAHLKGFTAQIKNPGNEKAK